MYFFYINNININIKTEKIIVFQKVDDLKASLQLIDAPKVNSKKLFFDSKEKLEDYEKKMEEKKNINEPNYDQYTLENTDVLIYLNFPYFIQLGSEADPKYIAQKMKDSYKKLADKLENKEKLQDIYLKLDFEKKLLVLLF